VRVVGVLVLGHTDVDHLGHPVFGPQVGGDRRLVADAGVVPRLAGIPHGWIRDGPFVPGEWVTTSLPWLKNASMDGSLAIKGGTRK
jgi:hypothetical protein